MAEPKSNDGQTAGSGLHVAPSPHVSSGTLTTRRMMLDVLIGLVPVLAMALYVFRWYAVVQVGLCVLACVAAEALFTAVRGRQIAIGDFSAVVTGVILGLSLPGQAGWHVAVIASVTAIGLGKVLFGGLGQNIFNPAMVGRAFVTIAFPLALGSAGYIAMDNGLDIVSQATPLTAAKQGEGAASLVNLLIGNVNGSLGETSALACILGGLYIVFRRTASWQIPAGAIVGLLAFGLLRDVIVSGESFTALHHLLGGSFLFGTFFIITDPVSSPLTSSGKWIYGISFAVLVMVIRLFSGYPEGVQFAVLLANAAAPLINRWTIPTPMGGPAPVAAK